MLYNFTTTKKIKPVKFLRNLLCNNQIHKIAGKNQMD
jgi:hypothetical protein